MTALTASGALPDLPMQVKNTTLYAMLAIAPVVGLFAMWDTFVFEGAARDFMDVDPRRIAYWTAILTLPHIIASLLSFADREYLAYYRRPLLRGVLVALALAVGAEIVIGGPIVLVMISFYTMYHNVMQQFGISLMMMRRPPDFSYHALRWMAVIPSGLAYVALLLSYMPVVADNWTLILQIVGGCLVVATAFAVRFILANPDRTGLGTRYFIGNMLVLYIAYALIVFGYGFLAMLVSRLVHDVTAYWIYIVHDQNRNRASAPNKLYAPFLKAGLQPAWICVPLAIGFTALLMGPWADYYVVVMLVVGLNLMHYYMEGHMWKRGTPHRLHVPFV